MFAKDVMTTQVITVQPTISIKEAIKLLVEIEISGLVVTEANGDIVGVVSEKDLLVAYDFLGQTKAPISDFLSRKIISVSEDTPVEEITKMLVQGDIRRVPVVRGTKVVGIVSRRNLLKAILAKEKKA